MTSVRKVNLEKPAAPWELEMREREITKALAKFLGTKQDNVTLARLYVENAQRIAQLARAHADRARDTPVSFGGAITPPVRLPNGEIWGDGVPAEFEPAEYDF